VASLLLFVLGLAVLAWVTTMWARTGFGALNEARPLFFALVCIVNGVQIGAAGYLFSLMASRGRMVRPDMSDEHAQDGTQSRSLACRL